MYVCMYVNMHQMEEKTHRQDHSAQVIKFFALDGSEEGLVHKPPSSHNPNPNPNPNPSNHNHNHNHSSTHNKSSTHSNTSNNQMATATADNTNSVFNNIPAEAFAAEREVKFAVDEEKLLSEYDEVLLKKTKIKQVNSGCYRYF